MPTVMTPELRAMALRLLGMGGARQAGELVNAPNQEAMMAAQEQQAMVEQPTPYGGPDAQPTPYGGPAQSSFMTNGVPAQNGGRMTPQQAAQLAAMLRARQ